MTERGQFSNNTHKTRPFAENKRRLRKIGKAHLFGYFEERSNKKSLLHSSNMNSLFNPEESIFP